MEELTQEEKAVIIWSLLSKKNEYEGHIKSIYEVNYYTKELETINKILTKIKLY